ncbi:WYL domain-containing protein [Streptosporangium sp. NBC_01755]|uniref:helix-turn-helix transcriptional regulator n=1 Tax=unclassified Streptosporangium TaxID=2632669 RepID=UPI002DDC8299|nr:MULTISPECIES: WYL domain-containing protein [unclassified Streptosporangium]WSA29070.1 WYL domain-containing protein [Streptosporangium sp. NBC_01810]WSC99483.1 WYL domain-containing protein [Streptosporangium sp. NBC_01755]
MSTADRLPRLLALVPYLMSHPGAQVPEVAKIFGLTEKQLIDDLQLVWMCGLPGHTPGDLIDVSWDGGEIVIDNADTIARPLRLGVDEASALLVALRLLAEMPEFGERDALTRVIAKFEQASGEGAAAVSSQVAVEVDAAPDALPVVNEALRRRRRLSLRYYVPGRDEVTPREVDPMRLVVVDGRPYLSGWCYRAEAVRLFRLDRMLSVDVLDVPADPPADAVPDEVTPGVFRPSPTDELVELELTAAGRWVSEYYPCEQVTELGEGRVRVTLRARDQGWVVRLALRLGDTGRVISPASLDASVRAAATAALNRYESIS